MFEDVTWRVALLALVYATDLMVFIGLCRKELHDRRASRQRRGGGTASVPTLRQVENEQPGAARI